MPSIELVRAELQRLYTRIVNRFGSESEQMQLLEAAIRDLKELSPAPLAAPAAPATSAVPAADETGAGTAAEESESNPSDAGEKEEQQPTRGRAAVGQGRRSPRT